MTAWLAALSLFASEPSIEVRVLSPLLEADVQSIPFAVEITPEVGWHLYWKNPGDSGMPPSIKWDLPEGWKATDLRFPAPERIVTGDLVSFGYEGKFAVVGSFLLPPNAKPADLIVKGKLNWMACKESCIMGSSELSFPIKLGKSVASTQKEVDLYSHYSSVVPSKPLKVEVLFADGAYSMTGELPMSSNMYFYSELEGVLQHQKEQKVEASSDKSFRLTLPKSEFASEPAKRLKGILQVNGPKGRVNYVIDAPVVTKEKS
jgi:DsbC/DsbD-like thiol-disulfide interchange protein